MWLRNFIRFLVRNKVITAPKQHLYAVEGKVYLDGKLIKQFPVEIWASSRRAAKFEVKNRIKFETGTTAQKLHLIKHG